MAPGLPLKGSLKGDIEIGIGVSTDLDIDIDMAMDMDTHSDMAVSVDWGSVAKFYVQNGGQDAQIWIPSFWRKYTVGERM